jgi:hypothetical protein
MLSSQGSKLKQRARFCGREALAIRILGLLEPWLCGGTLTWAGEHTDERAAAGGTTASRAIDAGAFQSSGKTETGGSRGSKPNEAWEVPRTFNCALCIGRLVTWVRRAGWDISASPFIHAAGAS